LNKFSVFTHLSTLFFYFYFDCQIRASQLTHPAANTILWSGCNDFVAAIQFQNFFGTQFYTNATPFAPIPVDLVLFQFRFPHKRFLSPSEPLAISQNISGHRINRRGWAPSGMLKYGYMFIQLQKFCDAQSAKIFNPNRDLSRQD